METPEGSVFELTAGKAPEGRPRGFGSLPHPPPRRGGFVVVFVRKIVSHNRSRRMVKQKNCKACDESS
jgi:hypothetical protein